MNGCMDAWMDSECMDRRMVNRRMDELVGVCVAGCTVYINE